jgi:hypothetical protein
MLRCHTMILVILAVLLDGPLVIKKARDYKTNMQSLTTYVNGYRGSPLSKEAGNRSDESVTT